MITRARLVPSSCVILLAVAATLGASPTWSARLPPGAEHAIEQVSVDELCGHVTVLAGDGFMGRGVGHPGNRLAEVYVADALRRANVSPAGESYFQPIQVYEPALGAGSRLTIDAGDAQPIADFTSGLDFYPLPASSDTPVSGPLVYAGYGISAPRWGHDDYKKIDARGAVVLVQDDAPEGLRWRATLSDDQKTEAAALERKIRDARAHGAVGLVVMRAHLGDVRAEWPERPPVRSASYRLYLLGYSYSPDLARLVEQANEAVRLTVKEDYDQEAQHLVRRSDNWPFLEHGVPAIFLTTGLHPDYHTPADDTDRIDFGKLERITELAGRATWLAADGSAPRLKTK